MRNFLIKLAIAFVTINLVVLIAFNFPQSDNVLLLVGGLFFLVLGIISSRLINNAINVSQAKFNAVFFGFTFLQLILALIYIAIYLKFNQIINKWGVILLVFQYFIYLSFEIQFILSKLRTNSKS